MCIKANGLDTTEISKLKAILDNKLIPYRVNAWGMDDNERWERYCLHVRKGEVTYSFLLTQWSYGSEEGLIEFYDFVEEPTGYLTADECMEIIKQRLHVEEEVE